MQCKQYLKIVPTRVCYRVYATDFFKSLFFNISKDFAILPLVSLGLIISSRKPSLAASKGFKNFSSYDFTNCSVFEPSSATSDLKITSTAPLHPLQQSLRWAMQDSHRLVNASMTSHHKLHHMLSL